MHLYRNEKYDIKFQYGGNSNMAAIPIWRQFQYGGNSNMAPKQYGSHHGMPNHSTKYNYYMTDSYIEISATPNKTNKQIDTHKIRVLRHSWFSNPLNQEAPKLADKENILHNDQNDNWNMNSDQNHIKNL